MQPKINYFRAYPQVFTSYTHWISGKIASKPCYNSFIANLLAVDKYKPLRLGLKVGKSVILCQQVVILEKVINE